MIYIYINFFFFKVFFSIPLTDPISGNAFDSKRKRKGDGLIDFGILGVSEYTTTLFGVRWVFITDLRDCAIIIRRAGG